MGWLRTHMYPFRPTLFKRGSTNGLQRQESGAQDTSRPTASVAEVHNTALCLHQLGSVGRWLEFVGGEGGRLANTYVSASHFYGRLMFADLA